MDPIQAYKHQLQLLYKHALDTSVQYSQDCWNRYPSKRKKPFNECSFKAAHLIHVFHDGKQKLKSKKTERSMGCASKFEGDIEGLRQCRSELYRELMLDLESLNRKILREEQRYNSEFTH